MSVAVASALMFADKEILGMQILDRQMWLLCLPSELLSERCYFVCQLPTTTMFPSLWNVPVVAESLNCYLGDEDVLGSEFADLAEQLDRVNNHGLSCSRAAQAFRGDGN